MQKIKIINRYAKFLFNCSINFNELDKVYFEIQKILNLINTISDLNFFIKIPFLNCKKKLIILNKLLNFFSITNSKFLEFLILNKKISLYKDIIIKFLEIYKEKKKWETIIIITAIPLNKKINYLIINKLNQIKNINKKYFFLKKVDPNIIGGFILQIKYKELDMSISNKIQKLRKNFINY